MDIAMRSCLFRKKLSSGILIPHAGDGEIGLLITKATEGLFIIILAPFLFLCATEVLTT